MRASPSARPSGSASKTQVLLAGSGAVDVIRGDLGALRSSGGQFNGTVEACLGNDLSVSTVTDATAPGPGAAKYYLVRGRLPLCNASHSWRTGAAAENRRRRRRDADIVLDADPVP